VTLQVCFPLPGVTFPGFSGDHPTTDASRTLRQLLGEVCIRFGMAGAGEKLERIRALLSSGACACVAVRRLGAGGLPPSRQIIVTAQMSFT